jgi:peptidoglycan/xylan/chitin deacetylase (PgdA/CDA1 family)
MILRDDDIYLTESPNGHGVYYDFEAFKRVHEFIAGKGIKHTLAIVAGEIENHPELTEYILERKDEFEFGVHGWMHENYSEWPKEAIKTSLTRAVKKIEEVFERPKIFFPPWNKRSDAIKQACAEIGLELNEEWMTPQAALAGGEEKIIGFHYWSEPERRCIAQILKTTDPKEQT